MAWDPGEVTGLLRRMAAGDRDAESRLFTMLYADLRRMASKYMRGERAGVTLQPTALVAEAYLRLTHNRPGEWHDRMHFLAVAGSVMRHVLVDYARHRLAKRRGAGMPAVELDDRLPFPAADPVQVLSINEALDRLALLDARQARIVELRYFAGLNVEETAGLLGISPRTVKREWTVARAWLHGELVAGTQ
jgi:RNA polymerase sigma factor (TIGR02999 family)